MNEKEFKELKVGDKVRIVSEKVGGCWNDDGKMDKWLGEVMTIRKREKDGDLRMKEDAGEWEGGWYWMAEMIAEKVVKEEVYITVKGDKTIAVLKSNGKVVKRAEAKCNPEDTFDFKAGAKLAFDRLFDTVREVSRKAKKGDWVKVIGKEEETSRVKVGDIFKCIKDCYGNLSGGNVECDGGVFLMKNVVVLEGYKPPKVEVKPHLESTRGKNYGAIGEATKYKDAVGRPLFVGDTVDLFCDGLLRGECPIVNDGKAFVMGIECDCDDKTGKIKSGWGIIKKRSYEDVKDGEIIKRYVKYIKS